MRAAAQLLSVCRSPDDLIAVVHATGITGLACPVPEESREHLGLEPDREARIIAAGEMRVLVARSAAADFHDDLRRLARRMATRAPHVPWLVAAIRTDGAAAALVAVRGPRQPAAAFVWEPGHVVDSDAETLCAVAAIRFDDPLAYTRCAEVLGRESLTRRFYRALRGGIDALAHATPPSLARATAHEIALLCASRLLFLRFLEAKGWLDGDRGWLSAAFDRCMAGGGGFHRRVLLPLFFGTLNTPIHRRAPSARALGRIPFLNGGLFARTPVERQAGRWTYPDAALGALVGEVFERFRFVAREDSARWSEASVDPEMLGRAFESLMVAEERRGGGVFYTPHALVERVAEEGLRAAFPASSLASLRDARVLDPACGSGAFLVYALERLAALRQELGERATLPAIRRDVLARSVYGVDRDPTAVWLCELRLWLSVVIESDERDPTRVSPLPNLDRNIRVGDSISGAGFHEGLPVLAGSALIERTRRAYVRATGQRKQSLARSLDRQERARTLAQLDRDIVAARHRRRELLEAARSRDLFGVRHGVSPASSRELRRCRDTLRGLRQQRRRIAEGGALPFSFSACFADAQAHGGFDLVLGNPPWVRIHRIPDQLRRRLRDTFEVFRAAHWEGGMTAAGASRGFASQVDLAALFVERGLSLTQPGGALSLLVPVKLWKSLAGGGVRRLLLERAALSRVDDLSESRHSFDAAVYPSHVVARRDDAGGHALTVAIHDRAAVREWTIDRGSLPLDESPGAPWLILSSEARRAFDRLRAAGVPCHASAFGAPRLGVKSGCNAAFLVEVLDSARGIANVRDADGATGGIELSLLRPALRGDAVRPWKRNPSNEWIIWTHGQDGAPLARLPARAREWLGRRYAALSARSDARTRRWWSLFRVDAADDRAWRVVWADIGTSPRALMLSPGDPTVPLNSCYTVRCSDGVDARALTSLLNAPLVARWLNALAEPARGGYRRYLAWTVGLLPIPRDWQRARSLLADVFAAEDAELDAAALEAYGLGPRDVAGLARCDS